MHRERDRARAARRGEHGGAEPGRGVQHELTGLPDARVGEARDERRELVLGHGEQHELAALDDLGDGEHGHAGQHGVGAIAARLRDGGDADDRVAGAGQGGPEHGPTRPAPMVPTPSRPARSAGIGRLRAWR